MGQIIRSLVSLCDLCVSVCVSVLSRSQFLTDFDEIWYRCPEPETKETFRWGSKSNKGIPYFLPNFIPNWHPRNAFSMGDLKCFSDIIYGPIIAVHSSNNVSWPPTPECENMVKGGMARVT